jgi:hypothetical protein
MTNAFSTTPESKIEQARQLQELNDLILEHIPVANHF